MALKVVVVVEIPPGQSIFALFGGQGN